MRARLEPMICPKCGDRMNQHGEKLVDPRSREQEPRIDPALGGVLVEMHSCPACGGNASRTAAWALDAATSEPLIWRRAAG